MNNRLEAGEYPDYFAPYLALVPEGDIQTILREQLEETLALLEAVTQEQEGYAYAPGKWTLKEVVLHIADTERIMAYRLLRIARGDETPLPGFEEELFVRHAEAGRLTLSRLCEELRIVREATLSLLGILPADAWARIGTASGHPHSVRALARIIAGHERHHQAILRTRYLGMS
ncbi:hypothetical protein J31TS4_15050 [Paenibacillus sp. J31TS4]|uniref:DinB family protein n=1 Tax=Paenibacillus sp. J31TS4 TaxID=2807195 RepID=UPI001B1B57B5|nr:DinB family protein [Paenibacillus sp. J31TS4]GIP38225.1 hypothetical protein J31TS4_15050 [Paenibacillus sp. J31TS4]